MATVKIDQFGGIAPRQHPTQLADGMAVVAHNCRLKTGKLVPLREPKLVEGPNVLLEAGLSDVADAHSMHVWRRADGDFDFLLFGGVTWSAPGNIAADDLTRIVVSGETGVSFPPEGGENAVANTPVVYMRDNTEGKVVYPIAKDPIGYPVVSRAAGAIPEGEANIRYTRFFYTWVDKYGMESPVSEPSRVLGENVEEVDDDLEYLDGDAILFHLPLPSRNVEGEDEGNEGEDEGEDEGNEGENRTVVDMDAFPPLMTHLRVYKVVTGTEEGRVQFIRELTRDQIENLSTNIFSITVKDEDAGEVMPEIEAPPADLSCIHDVPGAFYVGFSPSMPKTVCFSDIDLLYSWPIAYRYDVADNLVALAVTSNSVFALTEGWPYVLSGTAPESMSIAKLAGPAACVSARGVCVYRNAVYFVSNAGLMTIYNSADAGTVCQNLTDKIFTKDQWLALNPSTCVMGQHDGALFLYFTLSDGTHKGLTIDLMENASIAVTTHDEAATCLCVDVKEDKLYFVREGV